MAPTATPASPHPPGSTSRSATRPPARATPSPSPSRSTEEDTMNRAFSLLLLAPLAVAAAAPTVQLASTVMLEKSVTANGRPQILLEKPGKVLPGDKLSFQ